jgi:hypothetical protein
VTFNSPSSDSTDDAAIEIAEFRELRATIRQRGTARAFVALITFVSWGGLCFAALHYGHPAAALVPLVVLAAGFEIGLALHVGAERIGRYLFVRYEGSGRTPKWETSVAALGQTPAAATPRMQPLLQTAFAAAVLVNLGCGVLTRWLVFDLAAFRAPSIWVTAAAHVAVLLRIRRAVSQAAGQRARDAAAFSDIAQTRGQ